MDVSSLFALLPLNLISSFPSFSGPEFVVEEIKRIFKYQEDYYAILCVDRTFELELLKTNYKKIALLVHPDKNPESDAETAFKSSYLNSLHD